MAGGSFALALSGAVTPGPLLAVVVAQVARQGVRAAWLAVAAHSFCELWVVLGLHTGVLRAMRTEHALIIISAVGAAALLIMGWLTARAAFRNTALQTSPAEKAATGVSAALTAGLVATALNPYWLVWWATLAPAYMAQFKVTSVLAVGVFYVAHIAGDFAWYVPVAMGVRAGQQRLSGRLYQGLLLASAAFLVALGVRFGVAAVLRVPGTR